MDPKSSHLRGEGELALLAGVLLILTVGCLSERTLGEGPVPERMVPDYAALGTSVAVEIQGREFYPGVRVSYRSGSRHAVDGEFLASLDDDQAQAGSQALSEVTFQDTTHLFARVPDTLPVGVHDLTLIDPEGRRGLLAAAFTVYDCSVPHYLDADGDGRGDPATATTECPPPAGTLADGSDCDDTDPDNWDSCDTCVDADGDLYFFDCDRYTQRLGPDCDDTQPSVAANGSTCSDGDRCTDEELCTDNLCLGVISCESQCTGSCAQGCGVLGCCVPRSRCRDGACETCTGGCSCDQRCSGGDSCTAACEPGTRCRLDTDETDDVVLDCTGADCTLRCQDAQNCTLSCDPESRCLIDCNDTNTCTLDCAGAQSCGDGVQVCNRDCP